MGVISFDGKEYKFSTWDGSILPSHLEIGFRVCLDFSCYETLSLKGYKIHPQTKDDIKHFYDDNDVTFIAQNIIYITASNGKGGL